jgi:hypothetical protein
VKALRGALALAAIAATTLRAQVGYPPQKSPFLDVEQTQELTLFGGWFNAKHDPAGAAPQAGPMFGFQYEWRATGPLHLGFSTAAIKSQRDYLDPAQPEATRIAETKDKLLIASDAFLAVSLTGARSWHNLMPMVGAGLGFVANGGQADAGGFNFGTHFAFPWSAGVQWVPGGGSLRLRADVKDWMYQIKYPQGYYTAASTTIPAILTSKTPTSMWTNNFAMTVGASFTFKR